MSSATLLDSLKKAKEQLASQTQGQRQELSDSSRSFDQVQEEGLDAKLQVGRRLKL